MARKRGVHNDNAGGALGLNSIEKSQNTISKVADPRSRSCLSCQGPDPAGNVYADLLLPSEDAYLRQDFQFWD